MLAINRLRGIRATLALAAVLLTAGAAAADSTADPIGDLPPPRTVATVSITTGCTATEHVTMTVYIFQTGGRLVNIGIGKVEFDCANADVVSSVDVNAIPGLKFRPGPATLLIHTETDDGAAPLDSGAKIKLKP